MLILTKLFNIERKPEDVRSGWGKQSMPTEYWPLNVPEIYLTRFLRHDKIGGREGLNYGLNLWVEACRGRVENDTGPRRVHVSPPKPETPSKTTTRQAQAKPQEGKQQIDDSPALQDRQQKIGVRLVFHANERPPPRASIPR
jgi:hypothetical protein